MKIEKMLACNVIEHAQMEWTAPMVFTPEMNGSLCLYADYRKLNSVTVRDEYLIRRMDECTDALCDATIFSALDANSGY